MDEKLFVLIREPWELVQEYELIETDEILVAKIKPSQDELEEGADWLMIVVKSQYKQLPSSTVANELKFRAVESVHPGTVKLKQYPPGITPTSIESITWPFVLYL